MSIDKNEVERLTKPTHNSYVSSRADSVGKIADELEAVARVSSNPLAAVDRIVDRLRALSAAPQAPSAPVGVEGVGYEKARELLAAAYSDAGCFSVADRLLRTAYVRDAKEVVALRAIEMALAQQPAAVDEAAAIRAFEEHFEASAEDPYFEGELELWLTAWRKALAAQQQGGRDHD